MPHPDYELSVVPMENDRYEWLIFDNRTNESINFATAILMWPRIGPLCGLDGCRNYGVSLHDIEEVIAITGLKPAWKPSMKSMRDQLTAFFGS
jgi:hypothetical protein